MATATFQTFLLVAGRYPQLVSDLSNEPDVLSRSQLLLYMERCGVPAAEKDSLIAELCRTRILLEEEAEDGFSVNDAVAHLVNYYKRRGSLASATALRDQMVSITTLTDALQRQLFAEELSREVTLDTVDNLYRLTREVRVTGNDHYIACMLLFADMKRSSEAKRIEQRLEDLETAQRRYVRPLRELIDPSGDYVARLATLKRRMRELGMQTELLLSSQELDTQRRRINADLHYIDHILLRDFGKLAAMVDTLLKSLIEERRVKDAVVACLSNLDALWHFMQEQTVFVVARQVPKAPALETVGDFFADVIQHKLVPQSRPLKMPTVRQRRGDEVIIREERIWRSVREAGAIASWPSFVIDRFRNYAENEQLKAISLPMLAIHERVTLIQADVAIFRIGALHVQMRDFSLTWNASDDTRHPPEQSGHLPTAVARLSV